MPLDKTFDLMNNSSLLWLFAKVVVKINFSCFLSESKLVFIVSLKGKCLYSQLNVFKLHLFQQLIHFLGWFKVNQNMSVASLTLIVIQFLD